jgi:hypothetical protein
MSMVKSESTDCSSTISYQGQDACASGDLPIADALRKVGPFIGAILIVVGIVMLFQGSKFVYMVFGTLVGMLSAALFFGAMYSTVLSNSSAPAAVIGCIVLSIILGGLVTYLTY